ncbi:hypothetical protein GGR57DRAFT_109009 [Xylariaceae sp. FL1272]|nr:hypothetical protein GGR57DRAFT_109009 [Xylariaceae sp. FL1272]
MANYSISDTVKDLHRDLARKWCVHGDRIQELWHSFGPGLRAKAMKAGAAEGSLLKHSRDASLGEVYKFLPEYNLTDVTAPGDFLLDMLKHRATASLEQQYIDGFNGRPGDFEHIMEMRRTHGLRHADSFVDCWAFFMDGDKYGKAFKLLKDKEETLAAFAPAIKAGMCIPQSVGVLVLNRQMYLLQILNIVCEDILEIGSQSRSQKPVPKKPINAATTALSKLAIASPKSPLNLPQLIERARDQKVALDDNLNLICTEPVMLAHEVNNWFFSRPELIPDEKGRVLPAHTDKYISGAVLDTVLNAVSGAAIWNYMTRLLEILNGLTEKSARSIILQEISNLCHLDYTRNQATLKRHLATGCGAGPKWYRRVSNVYDNGHPRVALKGKPEELLQTDPQLHYMMRLAQPETTVAKAINWMKKLDAYQIAHPASPEQLTDREADTVGDMAIILAFVQSLTPAISMPSFNRKKAQLFTTKSAALDAELSALKAQLDLGDFVIPIDNLTEPGMAETALNALDNFLVDKTGTKIGFLYQDLVDQCIAQIQSQTDIETQRLENVKAKEEAKAAEYVPFPPETAQAPEVRIQERKIKEKTRPAQSSIYEITTSAQSTTTGQSETSASSQTFTVTESTVEVFTTMFNKSQARGSIPWMSFEAAMADLGFSVLPRFGSVYTFVPPDNMEMQRPLTLHRPHQSQIEGYKLLSYARRLQRVYGWREDTFQPV